MPLHPHRCFDAEPQQRALAADLHAQAAGLPLLCPHGHVDPRLLADPDYSFGTPVDLFIIPDHYAFRMLYSRGVPIEQLGVPRRDGGPVEADHRAIWQRFADHFYLFRGTPTGMWLEAELVEIFGVDEPLTGASAAAIYDHVAARLAAPEFRPRALFERFQIEALCTTDAAADPLAAHQAIRASGWGGVVRPTFRPDAVVNLDAPGWCDNLQALERAAGHEITSCAGFVEALEARRVFFREMGARASDHAALAPAAERLSPASAETLFQRALRGQASPADAARFAGHMLMEMARMSVEDGLVMQLHPGALRSHNDMIYERFGPDKGADIPVASEYTRALRPLLNAFGNDPRLTLVLFTLDETTYARELAPLAGHYPALRLGPPWWFFDSLNGMARYFDQVVETAGLYNLAGFNDDTRAFCSIPARHDLWRRASANWLAGLVVRHLVSAADAAEMMRALAYGLAKETYRL
ncbi:MAG: glucuronate isomerase [Anaerolineales bacterium]|nr:glucuronate isomerase [Anaerolineales bacterium]